MGKEIDKVASPPKTIAYGASNYTQIQSGNYYFVDKTHFILLLEDSLYPLLIRPRRMGKSLWRSLLECYYDVARADKFDELFGSTWIGQNPTAERNRYLILSLDFAAINPAMDQVERSFNEEGENKIHRFLEKYASCFSKQMVEEVYARDTFSSKLSVVLSYVGLHGLKLYVFIDEYDNFANTILSSVGKQAYHEITQGKGFYSHFFNILKAGTSADDAPIGRLFITGVSPIAMDDVTSGFNIGDNISLSSAFQEMVGFTEAETLEILKYYKDANRLVGDVNEHLTLMRVWYNHYRFAKQTKESVFNTDMVLYYVKNVLREQAVPDQLIDQNIKIDYNKLRHLLLVNKDSSRKSLNGNFNLLREIAQQETIACQVVESFPLDQITARENFVSLLYYFGLLTHSGNHHLGQPILQIPNLTVKTLMYGYLRDAFDDNDVFKVDVYRFSNLVGEMAFNGQWQEVVNFLSERIKEQTSIRDFLGSEKAIQSFLLAYLNIHDYFITHSEMETNKGYCDILLEPFLTKYPALPNVYLIELKYIPRSETASQEAIDKARKKAAEQLSRYAQDAALQQRSQGLTIRKLVLVFHGWELVSCEQC